MHKRQMVFILCATVAVILIMAIYVGSTINSVNQRVTQYCFDELASTAEHLADDLRETADMDRTILTAMAEIISGDEELGEPELCEIMKAYNTASSYVSYVELLRPDDTMLDADGTVRDVSGAVDFDKEARLGPYISGIRQSTLNSNEGVIRNAVPVIRDGKPIYILFGVVSLSDFAQKYKTNLYDGHAYVYLEDGDTGDFILDTWHKSRGNVSDFTKRQMLPGYSSEKAIDDMQRGQSGNLGFVSKTTGRILYLHYEPVGVNNWNVIVSVEEEYALHKSETVSSSLYRMSIVIAVVLYLYIGSVAFSLVHAYFHVQKLATHDQTTGLRNRTSYEKFIASSHRKTFGSIVCIYIDANGLHEVNNRFGHSVGDQMLCTIANALKDEFGGKSVYRIGGDEFVVFCEGSSLETCEKKIKNASDRIEALDYSISFGTICMENETGVDRIALEADELMLKNKRLYYSEHNLDSRN